jgi:hypothetical protein
MMFTGAHQMQNLEFLSKCEQIPGGEVRVELEEPETEGDEPVDVRPPIRAGGGGGGRGTGGGGDRRSSRRAEDWGSSEERVRERAGAEGGDDNGDGGDATGW